MTVTPQDAIIIKPLQFECQDRIAMYTQDETQWVYPSHPSHNIISTETTKSEMMFASSTIRILGRKSGTPSAIPQGGEGGGREVTVPLAHGLHNQTITLQSCACTTPVLSIALKHGVTSVHVPLPQAPCETSYESKQP